MITRKIVRSFLRLKEKGFEPTGILDLGAFQGEFAANMHRVYKDAHIKMVEPLESQTPTLQALVNELGNADYVKTLIGQNESTVDFYYIDVNKNPQFNQTGSSKYKENTSYPFEKISMQQTTLDKLLETDVHQYQLLKMDVQGAELDVLAGATATLPNIQVILMEVSLVDYNEGAPLITQVLNTMETLGFVLYDVADEIRIGRHDDLIQLDAVFIRANSQYRPQPPFN